MKIKRMAKHLEKAWGMKEHDRWTIEDWVHEIQSGDTVDAYWVYVAKMLRNDDRFQECGLLVPLGKA